MALSIEEAWAAHWGAVQVIVDNIAHGGPARPGPVKKAVRQLALAVLDEAARAYAQNYAGAHEADDVAAAFMALQDRVANLGKEASKLDRGGASMSGGKND